MFGSPETTSGGRALRFYASVRLDIRRIETLKEGVEAIGNRVRVKVVKNKVAPPFKQAEFDIIYGDGISWEGTVLETGLERKVVQKSGSYFSFGDERLGQGRQNATAFLKEHPDVVQAILQRDPGAGAAEQVISARLLPQARAGDVADDEVDDTKAAERRAPRPPAHAEPDPIDLAARALRHRDRSRSEIDERLARAGVERRRDGPTRSTRLERVGYVDDAPVRRHAARRRWPAAGYGDAAIRHDLARPRRRRRGDRGGARRARARGRAGRASSSSGSARTPKTAAQLARKGFGAGGARGGAAAASLRTDGREA